jgi:hypothetical protein
MYADFKAVVKARSEGDAKSRIADSQFSEINTSWYCRG